MTIAKFSRGWVEINGKKFVKIGTRYNLLNTDVWTNAPEIFL